MVWRTLQKILLNILILQAFLSSISFALGGSADVGGGSPKKIEPSAVQFLLDNEDLKNSLLNYLKTINVEQISEDSSDHRRIKAIFNHVLQKDQIQKDINTPHNYIFNQGCPQSESNDDRFACTRIGDVNGTINFEINKIADFYKDLSTEQLMIRLGSLALHEHIHHFQNSKISLNENEHDAYLISDYVKITAKIVQVPLLKWTPDNSQETPLAVVKYYNNKDFDRAESEYIKVTKTQDYLLSFEKCRGEQECLPISERKLNLVEAWTWGDHVSFNKALPYYLTGAALVHPVALGGSELLGYSSFQFLVKRISLGPQTFKVFGTKMFYHISPMEIYDWTKRAGTIVSLGTLFSIIKSDLTKTTSTSHLAIQDNNYNDAVIIQPKEISELIPEIREFIEQAPVLSVSKSALQEWDSNR